MERSGIASGLIAGFAATLLGAAAPSFAQPLEIRASYVVPPPTQLNAVWNARPEVLKHYGKSYTMTSTLFRGTPLIITALASNEIDLAMLGPTQMNIASLNAGMDDIRILADEIRDGGDGYFSGSYIVLKDGPVKKIEDLKGKTLATFAIGASADIAMKYMLSKHGLLDKRDYSVIEAAPANMKAMLLEKKADLVYGTLPFVYDPEFMEKGHILFTARDAYGHGVSSSYWTMRESYIKKNRAAIVDLLEDYLRLGRWYWDPANRKEVIETVAAFTKVSPAVLDSYIVSKKDAYRPPDEMPNLDADQNLVNYQRDLGFAKGTINLKERAELSLLKEALARLK